MSRIRSKNTKPEMLVRRFLHAQGFRYRLDVKDLPGKPDIVLTKYKTVILVHGCFWHGHEMCRYSTIPKSRSGWWSAKIQNNKLNDQKAQEALFSDGWHIIVIWQCELKKNALKTLEMISSNLTNLLLTNRDS